MTEQQQQQEAAQRETSEDGLSTLNQSITQKYMQRPLTPGDDNPIMLLKNLKKNLNHNIKVLDYNDQLVPSDKFFNRQQQHQFQVDHSQQQQQTAYFQTSFDGEGSTQLKTSTAQQNWVNNSHRNNFLQTSQDVSFNLGQVELQDSFHPRGGHQEDVMLDMLNFHQQAFLESQMKRDSVNHYRSQSSSGSQNYPGITGQKSGSQHYHQAPRAIKSGGESKRYKVLQKFMNNQVSRLEQVKTELDVAGDKAKKGEQYGSWSSTKVEEEVVLLKKARQMTQQSYQTRLRTGGSLVKPFKVNHQPDCKPRQEVNPFHGGHSVDSSKVLPEENSVMNSYFRHLPQLIQQNQTVKAEKRFKKQSSSNVVAELTPGSVTARPKKLLSSQRANSALQYSAQISKRTKQSEGQMPYIIQEVVDFKREDIKNMIWQLPIIVAEKPQVNNSDDFFYFQGCQMLHKMQFEEAIRLFDDVLSNCKKPKSRQMFHFNLAYALFKLNEMDPRIQDIWANKIFDDEPYLKMLARFNLSLLTYYLDLSNAQISYDQMSIMYQALQYFDWTMQLLITSSLQMMKGTSGTKFPFWLNLDTFTASCKKLCGLLKRVFDQIPVQRPKADNKGWGTQDVNPDEVIEQEKRMSQRVWCATQFMTYQAFFKRYSMYKAHLSQSSAVSIKQELLQSRISTTNTALVTKRNTQRIRREGSMQQSEPVDINFESAYHDFLDDQTPTKEYRSFFNMTPLLRAHQDFEKVATQVPTQSQQNFQKQLSQKSFDNIQIPFVESKRPAVIIRKRKLQQSRGKSKNRPQSVEQVPIQIVQEYQRPQTELAMPQVQLLQQNQNSEDMKTPSSIHYVSSLLPTPAGDGEKSKDAGMFNVLNPDNIESQEFPIAATSQMASSQISGILKTPVSRQVKISTQQGNTQRGPGVHVSLAGDVTFNTRKLLNQKKTTEPTTNQNVTGSAMTPSQQKITGGEGTGTGTWIRNSLIASTNPHTSIRAEPKTPFSRQGDLMIYERAPQSSAFVCQPDKYEPLSSELEIKPGFLAPPTKTLKQSKVNSPSDLSQMFGARRRSQESDRLSNVEILEEFKGPLINKDGELYDDRAHDQTYKKRLRMREVRKIQEYLSQIQQNEGKYNGIEDTISSDGQSLGGKKFIKYTEIDDYLRRLPFFGKYPYNLRQEIIFSSKPSDLLTFHAGETIFLQGDDCPKVYVILRGSAKAILIKQEYGNIPIIVSTFYDGREFGESTLYQVSNEITPEMVAELNKQKYTCEAMEETYVLMIDKQQTLRVINKGLEDTFTQRISFLSQIDLFRDIDVHLLLPLANNLEVRRYRLGDYILREGQPPKGLVMVTKGQLRVGSEQLNMRSKDLFPLARQQNRLKQFRIKGCFHDMEGKIRLFDDDGHGGLGRKQADDKDSIDGNGDNGVIPALEVRRIFNDTRVFQNERIRYDERGQKIQDQIVYKDFMTFFMLNTNDFFGGGVLLLKDHREKESSPNSQKEKRNQKTEDYGTLSVIADSAEVEVLIMDRSQMSYFPEDVQKEIYARIERAFMHECPYPAKVIEKIKDKFQEWERYKLETVGGIVRQAYFERKKDKLLVMNR